MLPRSFASLALLPLLSALAAAGCGDDDGSPADAGPADAGPVPADAAPDASGPACPPLPDVAPAAEPEPIAVDRWMMGSVGDGSAGDPVMDAILDGSLEVPAPGVDADGVDWFAVAPGDDGVIDTGLGGIYYAITRVTVPEGRRVYARVDAAASIWVDGVPQPGDLYRSRKMRVPLATTAGDHLVAVRVFASRNRPEVELWATPDEVVFNAEDLTVPDLRVGEDLEQWLGVPVLNTTDHALLDVTARVTGGDAFEPSEVTLPALAPGAVTKVPFELVPGAAWDAADETVPVTLRIESCSLEASYETTVELTTVAADLEFRRTFRSATDGSAQYYGVQPPSGFDPERDYALVLSLHGAGVQAIGQARAYSPKDWAVIVAATNRRPFGFDWEEWGRRDGLEVLADAKRTWRIDPTRVYLTGHSMGGHGTWHLGVLYPGLFATIGPSAGWASFYSYTGATRPTGAVARARAHSDTMVYLDNLARRGVYIIHGDADTNVPVREARDMYDAVSMITDDVVYHEEPGAGHWWDGDAAEGADCVDWPPLFDFMQAHTLDPTELDFDFRTPGPWVSPTHSYVTIRSAETALEDSLLSSAQTAADTVELTTTNVRTMDLDGAALTAKGIATVVVDGETMSVADGVMTVGPEDGKDLDQSGPLNQAFHRPFCFVYADDGSPMFQRYASYLVSTWAVIGNGHACALPRSAVTDALRESHNLIWVGIPEADLPADLSSAIDWDASSVTVDGSAHSDVAALFVLPSGDAGVDAVLTATAGSEGLLFGYSPFSSRAGLPDYTVFSADGGVALGFFSPTWD